MAANAFPEVFTVPPSPQAEVRKGLSEEQLRQYFDEGFVIVEDFIDQDLLNRVKKEWEDETNELVEKLYKAGKIKEKHQDQDFFHRLIHVDKEFPGRDAPQFSNRQELKEPAVVGASVLLHKKGVMGPVTRELWSYPKLLDAVEQIVGPEVAGNPIWNLRINCPGSEVFVPWHQVKNISKVYGITSPLPIVLVA